MMPTYAPNDITLVIVYGDNTHIVGGYTETAMVSVSPNNPRHTMYTSADNRSCRIRHGDNSKTLTISLNQTSYSNDVLWAIHQDDVATSEGWFQLLFKDNNGRSIMSSNDCYIITPPATTVSNGIETREWQIYVHNPVEHIGGNDQIPPSEVAMLGNLGYVPDSRWTS